MEAKEFKKVKDFTRMLTFELWKTYRIRMFFNFAGFISASIVIVDSKKEEIIFQTNNEKELFEYLKTL